MYILNGTKTELVNSDYVERFTLAQKDDATLITATIGSGFTVIGRYTERKEAESAMDELVSCLSEIGLICMPPDTGPYLPEKKQRYHGGKPIRRGGS